jgi:hypothetical protein
MQRLPDARFSIVPQGLKRNENRLCGGRRYPRFANARWCAATMHAIEPPQRGRVAVCEQRPPLTQTNSMLCAIS